MVFSTDCDLVTGKSGDEPYNDCGDCYRYDICKKYYEKESEEKNK